MGEARGERERRREGRAAGKRGVSRGRAPSAFVEIREGQEQRPSGSLAFIHFVEKREILPPPPPQTPPPGGFITLLRGLRFLHGCCRYSRPQPPSPSECFFFGYFLCMVFPRSPLPPPYHLLVDAESMCLRTDLQGWGGHSRGSQSRRDVKCGFRGYYHRPRRNVQSKQGVVAACLPASCGARVHRNRARAHTTALFFRQNSLPLSVFVRGCWGGGGEGGRSSARIPCFRTREDAHECSVQGGERCSGGGEGVIQEKFRLVRCWRAARALFGVAVA